MSRVVMAEPGYVVLEVFPPAGRARRGARTAAIPVLGRMATERLLRENPTRDLDRLVVLSSASPMC